MKRYLYIPEQYNLVVGDTFELFYHGIVNFLTIDGYDFELFYEDGENRGKGFSRKYVFTPSEADIGIHNLHIRLWNNEGEILEEEVTRINVVKPPVSPENEKVILLMGASDTEPGIWPAELGRRLIGQGGMPEGWGLKNISFIGSRERDGVRYEGYGGWTFGSYTNANADSKAFMYIYGDFSDKNPTVDQHSFYRDENGFIWKLETVTANMMKIICTRIVGKLPSLDGGRLVHESGGKNTADIVYTSAKNAEANPFWSIEKGRNDFKAYARRFGKDKIDEIVVTLTWNSHDSTVDGFRELIRSFAKTVHKDFPSCHISLVGGLFPSRDGFAQNYGISWPWFKKMEVLRSFDDVRKEISCEDPEHFSFIHLSSQYDMEYNALTAEFEANTRNEKKLLLGSNGLHIAPMGSHQMADAVLRHLSARFSKE